MYRKQLVLINDLNQVAWLADLTTEVGLVWGPDQTTLVRSCFIIGVPSICKRSSGQPQNYAVNWSTRQLVNYRLINQYLYASSSQLAFPELS